MVAIFHTGPVPPNQFQPAPRCVVWGRRAGQIVAGLGRRLAGLLDRSFAAHHDQRPGKGKIGGQGFEVESVQPPGLQPSVAAVAVDKKGASFKASSACACCSSLG